MSYLLEDEDGAPYPEGVQAIARERGRQITELGYDAEHDSTHSVEMFLGGARHLLGDGDGHIWVTRSDDLRDNLVRAGALIAAAIDRLDAQVVTS